MSSDQNDIDKLLPSDICKVSGFLARSRRSWPSIGRHKASRVLSLTDRTWAIEIAILNKIEKMGMSMSEHDLLFDCQIHSCCIQLIHCSICFMFLYAYTILLDLDLIQNPSSPNRPGQATTSTVPSRLVHGLFHFCHLFFGTLVHSLGRFRLIFYPPNRAI